MPSTHTSLHYHLVFSTKDRLPTISTGWRERLLSYMGGLVRGLEGVPLAIRGIEDHVLLVGLRSSHRLDCFLRDVKADSSEWVHKEIRERLFVCGKKGYAAFSVSASNIESVKQYILNQETSSK